MERRSAADSSPVESADYHRGAVSRIVLLPGLGADQRLFRAERERFPNLETPPWLPPLPEEPLGDYAARLAKSIEPAPDLLGGVSFGGMVAFEMARHLSPRAVVLIGSGRSRDSLSPTLRRLGFLARRLPLPVWAAVASAAVVPTVWIERLGPDEARLFRAMLRATPPRFLKWAACAILEWKDAGPPGCPVFQIHGEKDHILPLRLARAVVVVPRARHLVSLTHPREVQAFLDEVLASI
jgi:pimeloyl-ACP methyl ester carboxylesterase